MSINEKTASLHISVPIKWKEEIEEIAKERNVSISDVARNIIDRGLHSKEAQGKGDLILDYLRENLRSDLMLIWIMVSESQALAKNLQGNWASVIEEDMVSAYESCFIAIKILDNKSLADLVKGSGAEYLNRVFEIMQYLVRLQNSLREILNKKDGDLDVIKNLSPLIKENMESLLLNMIERVSIGVARCCGART